MAKRKSAKNAPVAPSPADEMEWQAEAMARRIVENHPKVKAMHAQVKAEMLGAAKKIARGKIAL